MQDGRGLFLLFQLPDSLPLPTPDQSKPSNSETTPSVDGTKEMPKEQVMVVSVGVALVKGCVH